MSKSMLYTATGDTGMTSLVGGKRVRKNSARLEAYGTIDELNSFIGVADASWRSCFGNDDSRAAMLRSIQNRLFDIGAYLATDNESTPDMPCRGIDDEVVKALEKEIDEVDSSVEPMRCFVLPGGTKLASEIHVARAVARRAERRIIDLEESGVAVIPVLLRYINRLSDYLFALARLANARQGVADTPWSK